VPGDSDLIYLDYAATTPLDSAVAVCMQRVQGQTYFNPSSNHIGGRQSAAVVQNAAEQLAALLNAEPAAFVWTSGATEANNLAIMGSARQREHRGKHFVTMRTEHKAVSDVYRQLEKQGFDVTWLNPDSDGHLPSERFRASLRDDTQLASIMHINNETGAVQDIAKLGAICREHGVLFHVDAAQSVGKSEIDLAATPVDLLSLTAHKFYGPKGIGALYVAKGTPLIPQMFGGGQQRRIRPGTLAVDLIAGLGRAAEIAAERLHDDLEHLAAEKNRLLQGIRDIDGLQVNGPERDGYPGILNVGVEDIDGESLLLALEPLCVATGSACNSQSQEPSYVLRALGRSDREAQSAIRFSFGRQTRSDDIEKAIAIYRKAVDKLRDLAPDRAT